MSPGQSKSSSTFPGAVAQQPCMPFGPEVMTPALQLLMVVCAPPAHAANRHSRKPGSVVAATAFTKQVSLSSPKYVK